MNRKNGKMGQAGLASLMDQQTVLINELNKELARQKDIRGQGPPAQNPLLDVVRNMENRLEETKWPASLASKLEDLETYVKESRPDTPMFDSPTFTRTNLDLRKQTPMSNKKPVQQADALDELKNKVESPSRRVMQPAQVSALDMIEDVSSSEDEQERRRKKEKKRAKREREYKRKLQLDKMERQRIAEEEKQIPDPAVLVHIFNPFRLLQWDVPPFEKYQQDVDEIDQKIAMKKRDIEVAKREIDEYNKSQVKFLEKEMEDASLAKSASRRDYRIETRKNTVKTTKPGTIKGGDSRMQQSRSRSTSPYKPKTPIKSSLMQSKVKLAYLDQDGRSMKAEPSGDKSELGSNEGPGQVKSVTPKNNKAIDQQLKDADGKLTVVQPNQIARSNSGQQSSNLKGGSDNQNTPEASFDEPQRGKRKVTTFPKKLNIQDSDGEGSSANTAMRVGTRKNTALTMNSMMTANSEDAINESSVEEKEPLNPDKSNFVFGMHPLNPDQIVINPKYPPQFFPYLYPHLYPHLFPKLYPHYTQNYQKIIKDKKRDEKKKKEKDKRTITVVLPDGRHILMNKKEFLAYQLALAQQGYNLSPDDLKKIDKDGNLESEPEDDQDSDELIKPTRDVALDVDPQKLQASTTAVGDLPNPSRPSPKPPGNMRSAGAQTQTNGTTNLNLDVPDT